MIKLKLSFGKKEQEQEFQIESGELLKSAVERATKEVPLGEFKPLTDDEKKLIFNSAP